jgi:hypothetical protein
MREISEQRRLTATWLNTVAAAVVSASTCVPLVTYMLQPHAEHSSWRLIEVALTGVVCGGLLHGAARRLLRSVSKRPDADGSEH